MYESVAQPRINRVVSRIMAAITLSLAAVAGSSSASCHDYQLGSLKIEHPWARATPGGAKVGGGYVKITNTGKEPDRLIGGSLATAGKVEVHEMRMQGDVMQMRRLDKGLEIQPGQTVELKPGSYHLMFMDITQPLKADASAKGTLVFDKAGTIEVEFNIEPMGASSGGHGAHQ